MKVDPHLSIAVIFHARVSFIVKSVQRTADYSVNLKKKKKNES